MCLKFIWMLVPDKVKRGAVVVVIVCQLDLQLPLQSVSINTKVMSLNPADEWCTQYNAM